MNVPSNPAISKSNKNKELLIVIGSILVILILIYGIIYAIYDRKAKNDLSNYVTYLFLCEQQKVSTAKGTCQVLHPYIKHNSFGLPEYIQ